MSRRAPAILTAALALLAFHPPAAAGVGPVGLAFVPITGCRAVDTRGPATPNGGPALGPNEVRTFVMTGTCGIPANALGLAVNLTVVHPAAIGFAVLYAGDAATPPTSDLAFIPGRTRASFALTALASDGSGTVALANASSGSADYLIDVLGYFIRACTSTITVTNPGTAAGTVNAPFSQTFTGAGGVGGLTFSTASPLPTGLMLAANGTLSGTPTQSGTFPIVVTATDANGCKGSGATYTLVISCQTISVTNPGVTTGTANVFFTQTFTQTGGFGTTTFSTASALPVGMTLAANGVLAGTPTQAGGFDIVVVATDANSCTGAGATYHLVIGCQTISVTNPGVTVGTAGTPFSQMFTQTGAIGAATFTLASGALPSGLFLAPNGLLSGTPTAVGVFPITVKVTDGNLCTGTSATYTLVVGCQTISVTNPATTSGTVDSAFSQTFTQTGALGSATFTTASTLPNGVTLAPNGVLSGTPTQPGTFPIVVTVTDANGCTGTGATYVLVIACQTFSVEPTSIPPGTAGTLYPAVAFKHAGGHDPVAFTETGALPSGMNFVAGLLLGTPTQTGSFPFTVTATDVNGCTASRDYVLVVSCVGVAITLAPASLPTAVVGSPFPTTTFTGSGGTGAYTFQQIGALPNGMQFLTDTLSGTPTQTGAFPITIVATDAAGCVGSQDYVVTVTCVGVTITVDPPTVPSVAVGSPFGPVMFTATGGTAPYTFVKAGVLPPGMLFGPNTLSGSPTQQGTFPFTITATDANGCSGSMAYTLVATCPTITITNPATTTGTAGVAFSQQFTQTGGNGTTTFSTTSTLPTGLTLDADGTLHGTTTQTGTFPIVVKATDANGCTGSGATYTLVINCQTITITNPGVNTGTVDASFSQTLTASGLLGTATWTETGALPAGVTLDASTGTLSGTPTVPGSFPITVKVTDANGCFATSSYTLTVNCQTITVTKPGVTAGSYNTAFSQTFTQTGAHGTATFTTASALPAGLALSTAGVLSGTPTQTGAFPIVVKVTDANGCTGNSSTYTLSVAPKLTAKSYTDAGNTQLAGGVAAPVTPSVSVVAVSNGDTSDTTITYAVSVLPSHGTLTTFNTTGTFLYTPNVGNTTPDTFTYTGTSNGVSATQTATIGFSGMVWYVDNASGGSHDGRSNTPFTTMTAVGGAATNNGDVIYVAHGSGSTTGAYTMKPSQQLIGAGATLSVGGILTVGGSAANTPTLSGTLTLASSVVVNGIDMSTGSSTAITGTSVTGVNVTPRDVATTTGTAVSLTTVDTSTFTFHGVSSNGAATGISLTNVNSTSGTFTVSGDGTNNASGGTIQGGTTGVSLTNVKNVSITSLKVQNTSQSGINGTGVTNFSFVNGTISTTGASGFQSNIAFNGSGSGFGNNIAGTLTITGSTLTGGFYSALDVQSDNGTVTSANLSNNTITNPGFAGINLVGTGNAATAFNLTTATINQNNISGPGGVGVQVSIGNSNASGPGATAGVPGTGNVISITNNSVTGIASTGTQAITVANSGGNPGSRTKTNFVISCNGRNTGGCTAPTASALASSSIGTVVLVGNNGFADMTGTVDNNAIVATHTPNLGGGNGIAGGNGVAGAGNAWTPNLTLTVTNNSISGTDGNGILLVGRGTTGAANLKIANNNVSTPVNAGGTARQGIRVDAGNASSADDSMCLNITGNTSAGSNGAAGIGLRKQGAVAGTNDFGIKSITPNPPTNTDVQNWVNGLNTGGTDIINGSNFVQCSSAP